MLRPPFKPLAAPLGVAPHSLRTTAVEEWRNSSLKYTTTAFFDIFINSSIINHPTTRHYKIPS
jgi:hypothetical protein